MCLGKQVRAFSYLRTEYTAYPSIFSGLLHIIPQILTLGPPKHPKPISLARHNLTRRYKI